jgi:hypothetical protein
MEHVNLDLNLGMLIVKQEVIRALNQTFMTARKN